MKKILALLTAVLMLAAFVSCGSTLANGTVDLDLSSVGYTMAYSTVTQINTAPDDYLGKVIRLSGETTYMVDGEDRFYAVLINDTTACCSTWLEFALHDVNNYALYPEMGDEVTVTGRLEAYEVGGVSYLHLADATFEKNA